MRKSYLIICTLFFISLGAFAQKADVERLEALVTELASDEYLGRGFGSEQGNMAADFIIDQFKESGIEAFVEGYRHPFTHRISVINVDGNNIVGIIRGKDPELADEYVIIGAHYDHVGWKLEDGDTVIYNGADDNASGVAAVIELGRLLNELEEGPGRSVILIAFDGEESGLLGSKAFVNDFILSEDAPIPADQVVAMFSLDMVGMYEAHKGVDMTGIEMLDDYKNILKAVEEKAPLNIVKSDAELEARTDTSPFGKAGIPSIHVFTGMESPYHKPEDDSDLLDYDGMALVVDFMAALGNEISSVDEIKPRKELITADGKPKMKVFNPGITANIGSSHFDFKDYYAEAKAVFSYAAGLSFETRLTQWLAIQPEVLYSYAGSQVDGGKLNAHSLTVPFSLLLTTPDEGAGVRVYYQVGGYYSYNFSGKSLGASIEPGVDFLDADYGYMIGVGFEIMNYRLAFLSTVSLQDYTLNDAGNLDARMKGSFLKVGYVF